MSKVKVIHAIGSWGPFLGNIYWYNRWRLQIITI